MSGNTNATQGEVNATLAALEESISNLEQVQSTDKTALENYIANMPTLNQAEYTPETWGPYQPALNNAKAVLNNNNATQPQVDAVLTELQNRFNGLAKVQTNDLNVDNIKFPELVPGMDFQAALKTAVTSLSQQSQAIENLYANWEGVPGLSADFLINRQVGIQSISNAGSAADVKNIISGHKGAIVNRIGTLLTEDGAAETFATQAEAFHVAQILGQRKHFGINNATPTQAQIQADLNALCGQLGIPVNTPVDQVLSTLRTELQNTIQQTGIPHGVDLIPRKSIFTSFVFSYNKF